MSLSDQLEKEKMISEQKMLVTLQMVLVAENVMFSLSCMSQQCCFFCICVCEECLSRCEIVCGFVMSFLHCQFQYLKLAFCKKKKIIPFTPFFHLYIIMSMTGCYAVTSPLSCL